MAHSGPRIGVAYDRRRVLLARPRLLVSSTDFPPATGGTQRTMHEITTRLADRWTITVVAPLEAGAAAYDAEAPFRVLRTRTSWRDSHVSTFAEMASLTARHRPDMVLAGHLNAFPSLLVPGRGRPKLAVIYGSELGASRSRLVARVLGGRIDRALAISRFSGFEAAKSGIVADRIVITPLGADPPEAAAIDPGMLAALGLLRDGAVLPFILTVSRLDERHKGHDVVLRALPELLQWFPDLRYVIAGEGSLAQELCERARRLGVHAVVMTGAVDERLKATLLASCRAYVMLSSESRRPALFEGFGLAFIEAAMAGRPSLAGRSGGVPDAVVDGQTGLLVDPGSVQQFIAAASRLLRDPDLADALGARAARGPYVTSPGIQPCGASRSRWRGCCDR